MTYRILSPDGFDIECGEPYRSMEQAVEALRRFVARYEEQGYYSTASLEHIPLDQIAVRCEVIAA